MARLVANFFQDVDEIVTRTLVWTDDLNGSTISGSPSWTVPSGLTSVAESSTSTTATIRLSAQAQGLFTVLCTINTAASETLQVAFTVTVSN